MKDIGFFTRIFLVITPVDFRKQAHGLSLITEHTLGFTSLHEKTLFVFTNKRRTSVKILYWDKTGYALWWKVLEKERFRWPSNKSSCSKIEVKELKWLLEGIHLSKTKKHKTISLH